MFLDIYLTALPADVDRDDVEDELQDIDGFDVVGAGTGEDFVNLDVEVDDGVPPERALAAVAGTLRRLGCDAGAYVRVTVAGEPGEPGERVDVADITP